MPARRLSFASATYTVDEGATNVVLTVIQTGDTNSVASVDYATADLGATAGSDYTAVSGSFSLAAGEVTRTVKVALLNGRFLNPATRLESLEPVYLLKF